jgi:hypothetical protein
MTLEHELRQWEGRIATALQLLRIADEELMSIAHGLRGLRIIAATQAERNAIDILAGRVVHALSSSVQDARTSG